MAEKGFICFKCGRKGMTYSEAQQHAQSCIKRKYQDREFSREILNRPKT